MHKKVGCYSCNDGNNMLFLCKRTPLSLEEVYDYYIFDYTYWSLLNEAHFASKSCNFKIYFKIIIDEVVLYYHIDFSSSSYFLL